ncbi:hypothetical protein [Ornithinimicrobium kibberense]|uniref:hypothetical protein n=1 Tax=Ornithinimicrobium kibberense TaxID=282060 RepID=UPI0036195092
MTLRRSTLTASPAPSTSVMAPRGAGIAVTLSRPSSAAAETLAASRPWRRTSWAPNRLRTSRTASSRTRVRVRGCPTPGWTAPRDRLPPRAAATGRSPRGSRSGGSVGQSEAAVPAGSATPVAGRSTVIVRPPSLMEATPVMAPSDSRSVAVDGAGTMPSLRAAFASVSGDSSRSSSAWRVTFSSCSAVCSAASRPST